jgi:PAS domain S-box-containing protein
MHAGETADETRKSAHEQRVRPLSATFRNILLVVFLIFVFALVQMFMLRRVCNTGMKTATSLEHQGLPTLNKLALLQEHLVLFRLDSYEYIFAQEGEKAARAKAAETIAAQTRTDLNDIKTLLPEGEGRRLAANLETAIDDLDAGFRKVRSLVDSDFPAAMKAMDQDIPPKIERAAAAANELKTYGYQFSGGQANATFGSFGWIKNNAVMFGAANICVAFGAIMFVLLAARRSQAQLANTLARLDERSQELAGSLSLVNATLESTADGIVQIGATGNIQNFNQQFVKMWRISAPAEVMQDKRRLLAFELPLLKHSEKFARRIEELAAHPEHESFDLLELRDERVFECCSKPQRIQDRVCGRVWSFRDVTERKQAEAALAYERDLLKTLMDYSPDSIFFKDLESRFVKVSRSEEKNLLGIALNRYYDTHPGTGAGQLPPHLAGPECFHDYLMGKTDADIYGAERAEPFRRDEREIMRTSQPIIGQVEKTICPDGQTIWHMTTKVPWRNPQGEVIGTFGTSRDISDLKNVEARVEQVHKQLVDASRRAGMAEVATGVLHNVGNVLNSVNVSTTLVIESLGKSEIFNVTRLGKLLAENDGDLAAFFTTDDRGRRLPAYVLRLAERLVHERDELIKESELIRANLDHIKEIVAMQQNYAKAFGVVEKVKVTEIIEDALRLNAGGLTRHEVEVVRNYESPDCEITIEKHKVLQILVNLIHNAKYACDDAGHEGKRIAIRSRNGSDRVQIEVSDNGVGIPAENMTRIFNHGFTTRKNGHGFGLHSAALAAKELGGSLVARSEGPQCGATFTLELPLLPENFAI